MVYAAAVAAIYAALTFMLQPISFGPWQVRVSEALCVLPALFPAAIPGLAVGCLIANMAGGFGLPDIIFGTLATLAAALLTHKAKNHPPWIPFAPVVINAVVVGIILYYMAGEPLWFSMMTVGVGQLIACYGLGLPLYFALKKYGSRLWDRLLG